MISLISTPVKVKENYARGLAYIIENYFNCVYNYVVNDNYSKKNNNSFYKKYVINSYNELEYFDFTQKVNLLSLTTEKQDYLGWINLLCGFTIYLFFVN